MVRIARVSIVVVAVVSAVLAPAVTAHDDQHGPSWHGVSRAEELARRFLADSQPAQQLAASSSAACEGGSAAGYPCSNVDLLAFLPLADIGGGKGNDVWGWTDPVTGREYALMGRSTGTSFVDITEPANPIYLGNLPTTRFSSSWRDIKVYADHAFIVSEAMNHGMQVFDLTRLRAVTNPPVTFSADALYKGISTAHNVVINEESGFAYVVGSNTCSGGLHIVDIRSPKSPTQAGCFSEDGYTHDAQCVIYRGPDADYGGREICVASNEDTVTIVDVTDKAAPRMVSRTGYGAAYTHQGWLTEDHRYFLLDDELDEDRRGHNTHTYLWDMADLDAPSHTATFVGTTAAIDHNQYVKGDFSYQANYRAGLRILDIRGIADATGTSSSSLGEVAYFDIYPADDLSEFNGAWSTFPYFGSGTVVVSGIEQGLFVLRPNLGGNLAPEVTLVAPGEGATVSGSAVPIEIDATDVEDSAGSLIVEWQVDGGAWQPAVYEQTTGDYRAEWDSTTVADGSHTIAARARDSAGAASTASNSVTVSNTVPAHALHVGDLDGTKAVKGKSGKWEATVTVTIHDEIEDPVAGASVTASWSGALSGTVTATTGDDGTVTFRTGSISGASVTLTIDGVAAGESTYSAVDNHDPDGDSDGSRITVVK